GRGLHIDVESKPDREANGAQHPQWVVLEVSRIDHAHHAAAKIRLATEWIAQRAGGQSDGHGVDREIAPAEIGSSGKSVDTFVDHHAINREVAAAEGDHLAERRSTGERII